jgi:low affinity Fe/Cu permease
MTDRQPTHGHTSSGRPVHGRVHDYHPAETRFQRFNKVVAARLTASVGTMVCFWVFCVISTLSLPATLVLAGAFSSKGQIVPAFFLSFGWIYVITWITQNFIQLVLLPALMVGQNLQNEAADARNEKTFEDVETAKNDLIKVLDALSLETEGGLKAILDVITERLPSGPAPSGPVRSKK